MRQWKNDCQNHFFQIDILSTSHKTGWKWGQQDSINGRPPLVRVMVWAIRQQTITYANVHSVLYRHKASLKHIELTSDLHLGIKGKKNDRSFRYCSGPSGSYYSSRCRVYWQLLCWLDELQLTESSVLHWPETCWNKQRNMMSISVFRRLWKWCFPINFRRRSDFPGVGWIDISSNETVCVSFLSISRCGIKHKFNTLIEWPCKCSTNLGYDMKRR